MFGRIAFSYFTTFLLSSCSSYNFYLPRQAARQLPVVAALLLVLVESYAADIELDLNEGIDSSTSWPFSSSSSSSTSIAAASTNIRRRHLQSCNDDSSFSFLRDNLLPGSCEWLASSKNSAARIRRYCPSGIIKGSCQATCGFCPCVDDTGFTFRLINRPDRIRNCDWLTLGDSEKRVRQYCYNQDGSSSDIGDACVASCGFCSSGGPTAPSPTVTTRPTAAPSRITAPDGCIDDPNYRIKKINMPGEEDCAWIAKREIRKERYCSTINNGFLVSDKCPLACDACGPSPPTSPRPPTASPVKLPGTKAPTASPVKLPGTNVPTASPVKTPVTAAPTASPVKVPGTKAPTASPVNIPVTPSPTASPVKTPVTPAPTLAPVPPTPSAFTITLINTGTNTNFDAAFASAKARWESIIVSDLSDRSGGTVADWFGGRLATSYNGPVDDVVIGYEMTFIDGPGSVLGSAGPTFVRTTTGSPIAGTMRFDQDDFANMSAENAEIIILHEMGHVLGVVGVLGACESTACDNNNIYTYPCPLAQQEYQNIFPSGTLLLENGGGDGTRCSHWEEDSFPQSSGSSELMTGFFEANLGQPITRVTIAALDESFTDYQVDYSQADPFPIVGGLNVGITPGKWKVLKPTESFSLEGRIDHSFEPIMIG